jgi:Fe2+ transport system protein B
MYKYREISLVKKDPINVLKKQIKKGKRSDSPHVVVYNVNNSDTVSILFTEITILDDSITGVPTVNNKSEKFSFYYKKAKTIFERKNDDNGLVRRRNKRFYPQTHIYTNDSLIVDDSGKLCITKEQITSMQTLSLSHRILILVLLIPLIGLPLFALFIYLVFKDSFSPSFSMSMTG